MPAHVILDSFFTANLAEKLRHAYRRATALTPVDRKRLLCTCLAHGLKDVPREQVAAEMERVAALFGALPDTTAQSTAGLSAWQKLARELVHMIEGPRDIQGVDALATLQTAMQRLETRTQALANVLRKTGLPLSALLERVARHLNTHDHALEGAARESFDRLLSALNPENGKKTVERKMWSSEVTYKAALYDAAVEKFTQLEMYHSKGRLVRDYKAAYKKYLQDESSH